MHFKSLPGLYISARTVADALEAQRSSRLHMSAGWKHCGGARTSPEGPVTIVYGIGGTARGSK